MKGEKVDIIFLLDKSGSMYGSENDTIGGFNSFIDNQIKDESDARVTTILFNHGYTVLYKRKDILEVDKLTKNEYSVGGTTALLDAIGKTYSTLDKEIDNKVLFVITTDGYENSSIEYSRDQIKNMINNHNWEVIYLGADIDSYKEAGHLGIRREDTSNYEKTAEGIDKMFVSLSKRTNMLRYNECRDESWKEDLE